MADLIKSGKDLIRFFDKEQFVEKTYQQINKDLDSAELSLDWSNITLQEDILPQLIAELIPMLKSLPAEKLSAFIYRVDLPEKHFLLFLKEQNYEQFAFEIILREAQKVYLRQHFS